MTACNILSPPIANVGCKGLEVIVTSRKEALEAEQGGADRLEVVRALDQGGLTPSFQIMEDILVAVRLPVRVMLREADAITVSGSQELHQLMVSASRIAQLPVQGLVTGFVRDGSVDEAALMKILDAAPGIPVTFHRAFEHVKAPLAAISVLKKFPQIDRILVRVTEHDGTEDGGAISFSQIKTWQHFAGPQIRLLLGVGLDRNLLSAIRADADLWEVHVGRVAREPETVFGAVCKDKVARVKSALL